jgi:hypothetical protein
MVAYRPLVIANGLTREIPVGDVLSTPSFDALDQGEEIFPRENLTAVNQPTSNTALRLVYFTAKRTETTTQVRVISGQTAAAATPTLCRIGLYLIDLNTQNGDLVAATANDTSLFATASTAYTRSWSSPYGKIAGQRYAMGVLVMTSVAAPSLSGMTLVANTGILTEQSKKYRRLGAITVNDLPSTFLESNVLLSTISAPYGAILP